MCRQTTIDTLRARLLPEGSTHHNWLTVAPAGRVSVAHCSCCAPPPSLTLLLVLSQTCVGVFVCCLPPVLPPPPPGPLFLVTS